jgi:hypothetical protein
MNGGSVNSIYADLSGITLNGGSVESINLSYLSGLFMTGGSVTGRIDVNALSEARIFGGSVSGVIDVERTQLQIQGGAVTADLIANHPDGSIRITGTNFAVDGIPIGDGPISAPSGTLTGRLLSGDPIESRFCQRSCPQVYYTGGIITLIPEPSTALLLAAGLVSLGVTRRG